MLAGLITNVFAAGACIVWLEGVGSSQREGMSTSILDSKRHSLQPATQRAFTATGGREQLNMPASSKKQDFSPCLSRTADTLPWLGSANLGRAPRRPP